MNRKEFYEMVDFSLVLNKWAAEQPGYKSPVTKADVEEVMAKIRPLLKPEQKSTDQAKLKYSMLVQIIKQEPPTPKPLFSMEVKVVKITPIQTELLNEKLAEMVEGEIKVTELGRRFVNDFERDHKAMK